MFEFHGWISVQIDDSDDADASVLATRADAAAAAIRDLLPEYEDGFSLFELRQTGNELLMLIAHGLRNHRQENAILLFTRVGSLFPCSYGLLYYHDDEHPTEWNDFRVLRVARGIVSTHPDAFLSPAIPTIEQPYVFPDEPHE